MQGHLFSCLKRCQEMPNLRIWLGIRNLFFFSCFKSHASAPMPLLRKPHVRANERYVKPRAVRNWPRTQVWLVRNLGLETGIFWFHSQIPWHPCQCYPGRRSLLPLPQPVPRPHPLVSPPLQGNLNCGQLVERGFFISFPCSPSSAEWTLWERLV